MIYKDRSIIAKKKAQLKYIHPILSRSQNRMLQHNTFYYYALSLKIFNFDVTV